MIMAEIVANLIGAFLWPEVYRVGLTIGAMWIGLPFIVAAAMLALVYLSLEGARLGKISTME